VRDEPGKERLVRYNREDCFALLRVTEFVAALCGPRAEGGTEGPQPAGVVSTADLPKAADRTHRFGRAEFVLPDLEFVNKCAYFDYQWDKVFVRNPQSPDSPGRRRKPRRRRRRVLVNKRVEVTCKNCPHCGSRRLLQGRPTSVTVIDMRFFKGGVKKWVVAYSSWRYECQKCGQGFRPPGYPQTRVRHGEGLAAWVLYHNVACGQNVLKVARGLREVFQIDVPQCTLQRFKESAAAKYKPTGEAILAELLRGPALHVDETDVHLGKEAAKVWVFAGATGAYYEYRESRDGDFLVERLKGFSGVLVTDFFTAYDSLDCPQQKCLIHLIRDMNEDLRSHPFDEELRAIARRFTAVVRPIIDTIDRHGLAKRYLQKHKKAATDFVEAVSGEQPGSDAACKYQKRIAKYGGRLFTFLDYDNVPWNNNNAEHAIKTFARYRTFADGRFTARSVADYLAVLTVVQTCEYRDVDVLTFLLSGKTTFD
jgi:DNA-directed RNA polymerase subunit RPC12/RpoP